MLHVGNIYLHVIFRLFWYVSPSVGKKNPYMMGHLGKVSETTTNRLSCIKVEKKLTTRKKTFNVVYVVDGILVST